MTIKTSTKTLRHLGLKRHGFTLIEFMVALAILAIMLAVALPSFSYWQSKNEADYVTDLIYRQLQSAREHAINHNTSVTVCGINAQKVCSSSGFSSLVMFLDAGTLKTLDSSDTLLTEAPIKIPRGSLKLNTDTLLKFKSDGSTSTAASFIYCPNNKSNVQLQYKITLNTAGRTYVGATATGDCPAE